MKDWLAQEIFKAVYAGDDIGLPDRFVDKEVWRKTKQELDAARATIAAQNETIHALDKNWNDANAQIAHYESALEKIAEAERMGYGTQRTYGEMAQRALEKWSGK